jgi:hypothetical protein
MTVSAEVMNTTFEQFRGPLINGFAQNTPVRATAYKKGKVSTGDGGEFASRALGIGSPARGQGMYNGDETMDRTRRKKIKKYRVEFHRATVSINIPQKELDQNTGKSAVLKLIDEYPKMVMDGVAVDLEKYLLTGKSEGLVFDTEELYGYLTFNGQFSSGIGEGNENGLLDFVAVDSQTDLVQNYTKAQADYHYNQYEDIGTWASDGKKRLRKVYRAAAQRSGKPNGGPDLMIMDDETYGNFQESKLEIIRLQKVSDATDKGNMVQDVFGLAAVYSSQLIDLAADFTGVALDGVTYGINTDYLEFEQLIKPGLSKFADAGNDQDGITAKFAMNEAMIMTKFPAHFCVSGGKE